MTPEARLLALNLTLPTAPAAGGNYVPARSAGELVFLSGVVSADEAGPICGRVGADRSVEEGFRAARACALLHLAVLRRHLGTLDRVTGIVSLTGYVNAVEGFADAPKVINGASDLLIDIFAEAGRHTRTAIGVSALPRGGLVETQMIVSIA